MCAEDPLTNVFVAARLLDGGPAHTSSLIGLREEGMITAMCWASANLVPVGVTPRNADHFVGRLRRHRRRCSSIFGTAEQVLTLWERMERTWTRPRAIRRHQPMMALDDRDWTPGPTDPRVRPAHLDEVDLVLPAAAHMFTGEIGYPPYVGSDREYRRMIAALIRAGHTYVIVERGRVIFKADVGSLGLGVAQIQGVWVAPELRGHGIAVPAMNAVVEQVLATFAPTVSLYVNDFNEPAVRTYRACGFEQRAEFATVIL
ncbi:GNAT family N-acetyltransferase [Calidifontibacter sp. DB0510]|uniref:GNAT family N-acetyltransferase n=1 Tax=Metallococcus carri TaxID=1656884 RepID=A0A967E8K8_9MICO|nr:GNAT family N-acetyltransferase [Metallococcus carri]NOP36860.1 GNAT family N-acetyltransferase [Calidifontibacter sp. DB2511S]